MTQDFAARLTRCPIPFDADRGQEACQALAAQGGLAPELTELIAGTAGCSPYLSGLLAREAGWISWALQGPPETALADALQALDLCAAGPKPLEEMPAALRQAKRRVALLTALADLGGVWDLGAVTGALTALADRATDLSMKVLVAAEIRRGKIPGATEADAAQAAGMVALAMGKTGARELNYSSDIDLILLFDDERYDPADYHEVRAGFIRIARKMTGWLQDVTADGYVFRTDLRLRPDASVTPVCIGMEGAYLYYEAEGRTWERAAYIKARPSAGDLAAGARFLERLKPFVWRRHLDFAAIRDAYDMRLKIRDHKGLHSGVNVPLQLENHDLKLGYGGIRDIEFFTQTRQLIAGGRDASLRDPTTLGGLRALVASGWVPEAVSDELSTLYTAHRELEHRLQMVNDAQTHVLPNAPEGFARLARMCGEADTDRFRKEISERIERVAEITESFFEGGTPNGTHPPLTRPLRWFERDPQPLTESWRGYPALRSSRAREIFERLQPELLNRLAQAANPDEAIRQFDGFLKGLPAGVQLFSMFDANPQLVDLIVDICASAPALARYLSQNARVLEAVIVGDFFAPWPGVAALTSALGAELSRSGDYEARLDLARSWTKELHFRIGVHHLRGLVDAAEAGAMYAGLAEAVVAALWPVVTAEFARRHGPAPGRGAAVIGMGSLGAGSLNAASDLDLIVIYDAAGAESSEGPKPLASRVYYARLTQALVTALSAPMSEGRLYEVDMRLRPSGRQGPVATSIGAFREYQLAEAWTWEHLALTRARAVAGAPDLATEIEEIRREVLNARAERPEIVADVAAMRARIFAAKRPDGAWEAKIGPGRLQDIELFAQSLALRSAAPARRVAAQIAAGQRAGLIGADQAAALAKAHRFLWRIQAAGRLLTDRPLDMEQIGEGGRAFLLRAAGCAGEAGSEEAALAELSARLAEATGQAADIIEAGLATGP